MREIARASSPRTELASLGVNGVFEGSIVQKRLPVGLCAQELIYDSNHRR
jgi:hypothetical protein